jgi:AAA family ATP:ADP antiporter
MNPAQLTGTEKFLLLFTDVKSGEGSKVLLMSLNIFLILCSYYFIKPLREGWVAVSDIQGLTQMEVKAYSSFLQSILLLFIVGFYGRLADRWDRSTLITRVTLFCISNLIIFWFLQPEYFFETLPLSGVIFYLWVGMFGVFIVAQFWTFCADIYSDESGKRLIPLIAIGATLGAVVGSDIVDAVVSSKFIETEMLLLIATLPLIASIIISRKVDSHHNSHPAAETRDDDEISEAHNKQGFGFLLSGAKLVILSRFLLAAAIVTLLTNWVNTNGENLLFQVVQNTLDGIAIDRGITDPQAALEFTRDGTTKFYGNFYFWVNVVALLLQSLVVSRLLKFGGFASIALMLPVIALISYTLMALIPILFIIKIMKIAENSTDYSVNNTARNVLWLPVDSAMKFKGKPAIDTLYVRMGDGLAALTVLIGIHWLSLTTQQFFVFNIGLVILWLIFTIMLIREHRKASILNEQ